MAKSIEMNYKESSAYEVIYPQTIAQNVIDLDTYISTTPIILSSATKELLGIADSSIPNDAFAKLALGTNRCGYEVYLKTPKGNPINGVTITGITQIDGSACVTDEDGYVFGVADGTSVNLSVTSPYRDLNSINSQSVQSTNIITRVDLVLTDTGVSEDQYTSSTNVMYSPDVETLDFCLVGGGGSGGNGAWNQYNQFQGAGGGNGGDTQNFLGLGYANSQVQITIGSGAASNSGYNYGGNTTINYNSQSYQALGGGYNYITNFTGQWTPGPGNFTNSRPNNNGGLGGRGYYWATTSSQGEGTSGGSATMYKFNEQSLGVAGGGGGGGGAMNSNGTIAGGSPYGGYGIGNQSNALMNGRGFGGGGGGNGRQSGNMTDTGGGYQGVVYIRIHK